MTKPSFSIRTMLWLNLATATFCAGWVAKDRMDRPPAPGPTMSPVWARREIKFLTDECKERARHIRAMETQLDAMAANSVEYEFQQKQISGARKILDRCEHRLFEVQNGLKSTSWLGIIKATLFASALILSFGIGVTWGRHLSRARGDLQAV